MPRLMPIGSARGCGEPNGMRRGDNINVVIGEEDKCGFPLGW
jgi:hypothetical protein